MDKNKKKEPEVEPETIVFIQEDYSDDSVLKDVERATGKTNANLKCIKFADLNVEGATPSPLQDADILLVYFFEESDGRSRDETAVRLFVERHLVARCIILHKSDAEYILDDGKFQSMSYNPDNHHVLPSIRGEALPLVDFIQNTIKQRLEAKRKFLEEVYNLCKLFDKDTQIESIHFEQIHDQITNESLLTRRVLLKTLMALREIQAYKTIIDLFECIRRDPDFKYYEPDAEIKLVYIFALNRRNLDDDRQRALSMMLRLCEGNDAATSEQLCMCGRIYKDTFVESGHSDRDSLNNAVEWYRRGFRVRRNAHAGVNLATLLVIQGQGLDYFERLDELNEIAAILRNLIGDVERLDSMTDYWDVATVFEMNVLRANHGAAVKAAERMFRLKPPCWYLKSTLGNIQLIKDCGKLKLEGDVEDVQKFQIWLEFLREVTAQDRLFPVYTSDGESFCFLSETARKELVPGIATVYREERLLETRTFYEEGNTSINKSAITDFKNLNCEDFRVAIFVQGLESSPEILILSSKYHGQIFLNSLEALKKSD